jgi:hypothetical protein
MAEKKAFPLRLDPELYEALRKWADTELRSVNGQIEYLLRSAVVARGLLPRDSSKRSPPDGSGRRS